MSQDFSFGNSGGGGGGIETINGDVGSITGSTATIYADNAANNSGSSVGFVNSGTTSTLNLTDQSGNTMLGFNSGNLTLSGADNVGVGQQTLLSLSSGVANTAIGFQALVGIDSGSSNVAIGYQAGNAYTDSEDGNIVIDNSGVTGENNTTRIGTSQTIAFMAGINSVTGSSLTSGGPVYIDALTGQFAFTAPYASYSSDTLLTQGNCIVGAQSTPINFTHTANLVNDGYQVTIKDESGSASVGTPITFTDVNGATIDGQASLTITAPYGAVTLYSTNSGWFII